MPAGASPKREREYKHLKSKFKREDRYPGREEEVASRIVNKQRREKGETKAQRSRKAGAKKPGAKKAARKKSAGAKKRAGVKRKK